MDEFQINATAANLAIELLKRSSDLMDAQVVRDEYDKTFAMVRESLLKEVDE